MDIGFVAEKVCGIFVRVQILAVNRLMPPSFLSPPLFNGVATYGYYCALIIRGIIGMDAQFTDDAPTKSLQR